MVGIGPFSNWRLYGYQFGLLSEGVAILLIETITVFLAFLWAHRRGALRRTIVPPLVMLAALFVELDVILVPGRTAAEPRYLYAGVLILLLVVVELARGLKATRTTVAVVFALTAAAVVGNLARAHDARTMLHEYSVFSKADMTVIELAGADADQYFTPNQGLARVVPGSLILNTGPWLAVVDKYNSVAFSVPELRAQAEDVRVQADRVAKRALLLRLEPVAAAAGRGCREVAPGAAATSFALPPGGAVLRPRELDREPAPLGRRVRGRPRRGRSRPGGAARDPARRSRRRPLAGAAATSRPGHRLPHPLSPAARAPGARGARAGPRDREGSSLAGEGRGQAEGRPAEGSSVAVAPAEGRPGLKRGRGGRVPATLQGQGGRPPPSPSRGAPQGSQGRGDGRAPSPERAPGPKRAPRTEGARAQASATREQAPRPHFSPLKRAPRPHLSPPRGRDHLSLRIAGRKVVSQRRRRELWPRRGNGAPKALLSFVSP